MIATTPALRAEVEAALPALRDQAKAPAGPAGVGRVIGSREALYPPMNLSDGAKEAWWNDYIETLSDLPESALEAGMRLWIKQPDSQFMPKPGQLRQLALTAENRAVRAYERAKAALEWEPPKVYERQELAAIDMRSARPSPSPEDIRRVKDWAKDYIAQTEALKVAASGPEMPPVQAETDEQGLSPGMRELIQRRAAQA